MCAYLKQRKKENQHKTPTSTVEIKDVTTAAVGVLPLLSVTRSQENMDSRIRTGSGFRAKELLKGNLLTKIRICSG